MLSRKLKNKIKAYREQLLKEEREKAMLLNSETNFSLLETLVQKCNANPNLRIDVHLKDGAVINLKTFNSEPKIDPYAVDVVEDVR